ncbi:MAG: hypothetical protein PHI36_01760 [Bacteroidales bacterium]|nr:hypothetical protein [Bacteroidales bacterium]
MKFFKFSIVSLFITIFLTSCGPTEKEIDRYNNAIVIQQNAVINAETELINAIMDNDTMTIPITLNDFIYQIETSLTAVQEIEEIDPDISLKEAAISMFNAYLSIAINEYPEIIELKKLSDQEFTEDKEKRFNQLSSKINQILDKKNMEFSETQKKLSEKHKIVFKTFLNGQ